MADRRIGLWLIGAFGGVGTTTAVGISALSRGLTSHVGMVTALKEFQHVDFDSAQSIVVGGHDIRQGSFSQTAKELNRRSGVFTHEILTACEADLAMWSKNVRPGVLFKPNAAITNLVDRKDVSPAKTAKEAISQMQADFLAFKKEHKLDQVVVVNVASTEPLFELSEMHRSLKQLDAALQQNDGQANPLPTSSLYAYAAIDAGLAYVNLTPSLGATIPAIEEKAIAGKVPHAGQDAKTGETLLKSVLAPMFAKRNLKVLSWVGHNILGNRDGLVLSDPANKSSKIKSKEALLSEMLGYKPQSHVSIEYIESLDDWKTAWDHVHFEGFLGTKMTFQLTWQGCDSILAAPLVLDLARLTLLAQRQGKAGALTSLGVFFKSPIGCTTHDFSRQFDELVDSLK